MAMKRPKRPPRPKDPAQLAKLVVDMATGKIPNDKAQVLGRTPAGELPKEPADKPSDR